MVVRGGCLKKDVNGGTADVLKQSGSFISPKITPASHNPHSGADNSQEQRIWPITTDVGREGCCCVSTGGHRKARREHSECQHQNAVKAQEPTKKLRRIDGIRGIERSDVSVVVRLKLRRPLRRFLAQPIDVGDPTVFNILRGEEYRAREQQ